MGGFQRFWELISEKELLVLGRPWFKATCAPSSVTQNWMVKAVREPGRSHQKIITLSGFLSSRTESIGWLVCSIEQMAFGCTYTD